jgi:hypothetical protein
MTLTGLRTVWCFRSLPAQNVTRGLKPPSLQADNMSDAMKTAPTHHSRSWLVAAATFVLLANALMAADSESKADSVLFKESKVSARADGKDFQPTNTVVLPNDVRVHTNGVFTVGKGRERHLKAGQGIDSAGMLSSPDGTLVPVIDHLVMLNGQLNLVKDGESQLLLREYKLADGTVLQPQGTIRGADGLTRRLLDGQVFKLDGSALESVDTVTRIKGEIILQKDGGRITLKPGQVMMMSDGTKVSGDGLVTKPDGSKTTISEGQVVRIEGVKGARP